MNMVATAVTTKRPDRAELRRRLEAAALELWRAQGFEAVSVDAIVSRAGVSKGAFFIFFPTKADALGLYAEALQARLAPARALLDPERPLSSLDAFAAAAEAALLEEEALTRALWRELGGRAYRALTGAERDAFAVLVAGAQAAGRFDADLDAALAGAMLADAWAAALLAWAGGGAEGGIAEAVRPKWRLLVGGLC